MAHVSKEEIALLIPNTLSHYFKDEVDYMPKVEEEGVHLFARIGAMFRWIAELPQRRAVMDELSALSEHELADIGLTRSDLPHVFDPAFSEQRNSERQRARFGASRSVNA